MTLPAPTEDVACPICGAINRPDRLLSTHSFGSPDLDLRPAPAMGQLLEYMVEACLACGYAASSLDDPPKPETAATMASLEWKALLSRKDLPELAAAFKRAELIASKNQDVLEAVWMALRAVWVCDDDRPSSAPALRREAVERILQARSAGTPFVPDKGGEEALIADLFRRAGDWNTASEWVKKGLDVTKHPIILPVLHFEQRLIESKDGEVHQIEEAVESERARREKDMPKGWTDGQFH